MDGENDSHGDFAVWHLERRSPEIAPLLLVLTVGSSARSPMIGGLLATATAAALLLIASTSHRLEVIAMYLSFVGMGWLVGYLISTRSNS